MTKTMTVTKTMPVTKTMTVTKTMPVTKTITVTETMTLECLVFRTYHTQSVLSAAQISFFLATHLGKKGIVLVERLLTVQKADSVICHNKPVQVVV